MTDITLYTSVSCPYCHAAKALLTQRGLSFTEIDVSTNDAARAEAQARSQRRTVPQIFAGEQHIGGFDDLQAWFARQG